MGIAKPTLSSIVCSSSSKKSTTTTTTAQAAATTTTTTTTITSINNNINKRESNINNSENSMSHEYHQQPHHHHQAANNIFNFPNGFDRSAGLTQQPAVAPTVDDPSQGLHHHDHHHHHHHQNQDQNQNHQVYETAGMLSEMFNFPHGPGPGHHNPGSDLLDYRRQVGGPLGPTDWYGPNRQLPRDDDQMGGISAHDSAAAAMQLFLTNPPPKSPSSPPQPPQQPPPPPNIQSVVVGGGGGFHHSLTNNDPTNTTQNHPNFWSNPGLSGIIEGQGLSLSLSSSLQHLEAAKQAQEEFTQISGGPTGNENPHNILFFNNQHQPNIGPSSTAPTTSPGGQFFKNLAPGPHPLQPMGGFGGPSSAQHSVHLGYGSAATSSLGVVNVLRNSKYAKPAQELLEEFCSVGRGQIKKPKLGRQNSSNQNPTTSGGGGSSGGKGGSSSSTKDPPQLSPADRIEHQRRKVKLLAMLDEVDRRYNHYCEQMQMVVNSFDLIMGYGAAIPYTALAQKAMSRHFRCLKDAIHVQLKHSCEMLGEKDPTTSSGITKGETPRLKVLEQSLRQQRAFHQMGMMDQEAWRPQRGLPERSVNILRAWLFEHFLHPYPSDADKHLLARQTGLSRNQVSNWFINARVRLWKPMIEEMYQQEAKELEEEREREGHQTSSSTSNSFPNQQPPPQQPPDPILTEPPPPPPPPQQPLTQPNTVGVGLIQPNFGLHGDDTCHFGGDHDDVGPTTMIRFGTSSGDVSLTLGLRHAGNAPEKGASFSIRDFAGSC